VPFWLKPGEAAVALGTGEVRAAERIPAQLRRFLRLKHTKYSLIAPG